MERLEGQHLVLGDAFGAFEVVAAYFDGIIRPPGAAEDQVVAGLFGDITGIDGREEGINLGLIEHFSHGADQQTGPDAGRSEACREDRSEDGTGLNGAVRVSDGRDQSSTKQSKGGAVEVRAALTRSLASESGRGWEDGDERLGCRAQDGVSAAWSDE